MIYKDFQGKKLSALGLGLMRLPVIEEDNAKIDKAKTKEMIEYAMANGINYYDTAYNYHDGNSERVAIGEILSKYPRDSYYLASKFPGFNLENIQNAKGIFEEQLAKCQVDHFDFYLFHSLTDSNIDNYVNKDLGLMNYLLEQKAAGRIRHLGFSTHASLENTKLFLDTYQGHIEFCQIQLNWIDYSYQDAKAKVDLLREYKLPVWVMEPLRGGYLASLGEEEEAFLRKIRPEETIPAWSFRYLQSFPDVTVTLSGMSTMQQLKENIVTYSEDKALNEEELAKLADLAEQMLDKLVVPCTACRYCEPECPKLLDIPFLMDAYNRLAFREAAGMPGFMKELEDHKLPNNCIACHRCEKQCPQNIRIAETMAKLAAKIAD